MRQLITIALASALSLSTLPVPVMAAGTTTASIAGIAQSPTGQTVTNSTVQLRDLSTGVLVGSATRSMDGSFGFTGLAAGNYAIEVVNATGQIVGTSSVVPVAAGAAIANVTVTTSATATAAAAAATKSSGMTGRSKALLITTAAAVAGIAAAIAVVNDASPSK